MPAPRKGGHRRNFFSRRLVFSRESKSHYASSSDEVGASSCRVARLEPDDNARTAKHVVLAFRCYVSKTRAFLEASCPKIPHLCPDSKMRQRRLEIHSSAKLQRSSSV